jgi:hypothetical protein
VSYPKTARVSHPTSLNSPGFAPPSGTTKARVGSSATVGAADHSASSYGTPVLVIEGEFIGPPGAPIRLVVS